MALSLKITWSYLLDFNRSIHIKVSFEKSQLILESIDKVYLAFHCKIVQLYFGSILEKTWCPDYELATLRHPAMISDDSLGLHYAELDYIIILFHPSFCHSND